MWDEIKQEVAPDGNSIWYFICRHMLAQKSLAGKYHLL